MHNISSCLYLLTLADFLSSLMKQAWKKLLANLKISLQMSPFEDIAAYTVVWWNLCITKRGVAIAGFDHQRKFRRWRPVVDFFTERPDFITGTAIFNNGKQTAKSWWTAIAINVTMSWKCQLSSKARTSQQQQDGTATTV